MRKTSLEELVVIHVLEDISEVAGGVPAVVRQLSIKLLSYGVEVAIVHARGEPSNVPPGVHIFRQIPDRFGSVWCFSSGLANRLREIIRKYRDRKVVLHIHGVWSAPQYFAARIAHEWGIPFVFTAHGMLERWLWDSQGYIIALKKRVYWAFVANKVLSKANIVHAITKNEREGLRELLPGRRFEVIPNAIDLSLDYCSSNTEREKVIFFLGRVEPKKGVDILLRSFAGSSLLQNWSLVIAGPFWSDKYKKQLESIVLEENIHDRVIFLGSVFGPEKEEWLKRAWIMAVPSHSEAIGLVNLEAAVYGLPTITTFQTGLFDWEEGGGLLTQPEVIPLRMALETACSWSLEERNKRGLRSQMLVKKRYSWDAVLPEWISLYKSVLV